MSVEILKGILWNRDLTTLGWTFHGQMTAKEKCHRKLSIPIWTDNLDFDFEQELVFYFLTIIVFIRNVYDKLLS